MNDKLLIGIVSMLLLILTVPFFILLSNDLPEENLTHTSSVVYEFKKPIVKKPKTILTPEVKQIIKKNPNDVVEIIVNAKDKDTLLNKGIGKAIKETSGSILFEVKANEIDDLIKDTRTTLVEENILFEPMLSDSVPLIGADIAWNYGFNGSGVNIAILDTGIDLDHDMFPQGKVISTFDATELGSIDDFDGHGSHVAGIAAGNGPKKGVAPGANLMIVQVFKEQSVGSPLASDMDIRKGIEWAVQSGADIISMSLGSQRYNPTGGLLDVIKEARDQGVIVVISAGNCGPASSCKNGYKGITYPSHSLDAISVGSTSKSDIIAPSSSRGPIDGILKPDVSAPGVSITSATPGNGYAVKSGTSMAAPHVAGALAILKQKNPDLNFKYAMKSLELTSLDLGNPGKDTEYGFGRLLVNDLIKIDINTLYDYNVQYSADLHADEVQHLVFDFSKPIEQLPLVELINPLGEIESVDLVKLNETNYAYDYKLDNVLGVYTFNITLYYGDYQKTNQYSFRVSSFNSSLITGVNIPNEAGISSGFKVNVDLRDSPINPLIEVQLRQGDRIFASEFDNDTLINMQADVSPGNYTVRTIVSNGSGSDFLDKMIVLKDDKKPFIINPDFFTVNTGMPANLIVYVVDHSNINGSFEIKKPDGTVLNQEFFHKIGSLHANIIADQKGTYSYKANLCDEENNCLTTDEFIFEAIDCEKEKLLVISARKNQLKNYLEGYCIGVLDKRGIVNYDIDYLSQFKGVLWRFDNEEFDYADLDAISNMIEQNKTIVIEGNGLGSKFQGEPIIDNLLRSGLSTNILPSSANQTMKRVKKLADHPITKNLPENFDLNFSIMPKYDSMQINNALNLASFDQNGSAIYTFESMYSRVVFLSFNIEALNNNLLSQFVPDIANFITEDKNNNYKIINHTTNILPVKDNNFILMLNSDSDSGKISLYQNNEFIGEKQIVQGNVSFELALSNSAEFKAVLNTNKSEAKYLDNHYSFRLTPVQKIPDLSLELIPIEDAKILVKASNFGGDLASSEILVEYNGLQETYDVSLDVGQTKEIVIDINSTSQVNATIDHQMRF